MRPTILSTEPGAATQLLGVWGCVRFGTPCLRLIITTLSLIITT
jgi:hypothetical protein